MENIGGMKRTVIHAHHFSVLSDRHSFALSALFFLKYTFLTSLTIKTLFADL
jgi:hypothetical protein